MKINRAIVSSDENQLYVQFWPIVAKAWTLLGIKPTLFLISNDMKVDETIGDVIRVKPVDGISTSLQAQCVRLLAPTRFPDEVSITSDIDMMPLNHKYFIELIKNIDDDAFVIFSSDAYENILNFPCFPMCYNAALGSVFYDVFGFTMNEYDEVMKKWNLLNHGWTTDERVLYSSLSTWSNYGKHSVNLRRGFSPFAAGRIDRACMKFDNNVMMKNGYIDFHMPRPYDKNKKFIDHVFEYFKISRKIYNE